MTNILFHHGTSVIESADQLVSVRSNPSNVIFLQGTAPDADATAFPIDTPRLLMGSANYSLANKLGKTGTLRAALDSVLAQGTSDLLGSYVYVSRIAQGASYNDTLSNAMGDPAAMTGIYAARKIGFNAERMPKPKIFIAPGLSGPLAASGVMSVNVEVQGSNYTTAQAVAGGPYGSRVILSCIVSDGKVQGIIVKKPGYGFDVANPPPITITGDGTGAMATAAVGPVGNPLVHEMDGLLAKMRAVAFVDGPNTTDEDAILGASRYNSDRIYMCDPYVEVWSETEGAYVPSPASGRFAGVQCRTDVEVGVYKSVSNELIFGIDGIVRPIRYGEETDLLGQAFVGSITNYGDGLRTWGNRSTSGMFLCTRRARDAVNEAIERAYLKYVDRAMTQTNMKLIVESGSDFLAFLQARDTVMPGWSIGWSRERNQPSSMAEGIAELDMAFETPPPLEDIRVTTYRQPSSYKLLLNGINGAIEYSTLGIAA